MIWNLDRDCLAVHMSSRVCPLAHRNGRVPAERVAGKGVREGAAAQSDDPDVV
jgi:hypothetical protein